MPMQMHLREQLLFGIISWDLGGKTFDNKGTDININCIISSIFRYRLDVYSSCRTVKTCNQKPELC